MFWGIFWQRSDDGKEQQQRTLFNLYIILYNTLKC